MGLSKFKRIYVRDGIFDSKWIRLSKHGRPTRRVLGPEALIHRSVVRSMYRRDAFTREIAGTILPDEHWLMIISKWFRRIQQLHRTTDPETRVGKTLEKMLHCSPSGYHLEDPHHLPWTYCGSRFCPFCYSRNVTAHYKTLLKAYSRRPPGSPCWVSIVRHRGPRSCANNTVRSAVPAAAICSVIPPYRYVPVPGKSPRKGLEADTTWTYRFVMLSDSERHVRHRRYGGRTYPVKSKMGIALAVYKACAYPASWARCSVDELGRLIGDHTAAPFEQAKLWSVYGACRDDYVRGQGLLDYQGYGPHAETLDVDPAPPTP